MRHLGFLCLYGVATFIVGGFVGAALRSESIELWLGLALMQTLGMMFGWAIREVDA